MKWFYVISLAVVAALAVSPMFYLPRPDADEYAGRIVRFDVYGSAIKSFDPATCGDTTSTHFQGHCYEGLYTYHFLKRPLEVVPQLAAEMPEISADRLVYRVKLRPGVRYHRNACFGLEPGGRPKTRTVTAGDFVLSFKRVADYHVNTGLAWAFVTRLKGLKGFRDETRRYKMGDFSRYDLPVEGLKALDDLTLQFTLSEPFPQFAHVLAMHVYAPVPREVIDYWLASEDDGEGGRRGIPVEKRTTEIRQAEQVVGTGPYVLKSWIRKNKLIFVRNEDFRDQRYPSEGEGGDEPAAAEARRKVLAETRDAGRADAACRKVLLETSDAGRGLLDDAGKPVPFIDALHYDFVAETQSGWLLFLTRQRDSSGISKDIFETVINPQKQLLDRWRKRGIRLVTYWQPTVYWIVFNMEDPVLGASRSLRQALCASFDVESYLKVLYNGRGKRAVNILPSSFAGWKEAGPGPYFKLDMDLARRKLAEAKKELAAKGLLRSGEVPQLTLDMSPPGGESARRGEFFQQQFAKLGLRLRFNLNDWPKQQEKVNNKQVQMYTMGWQADYPDAENFLQLYYSPNIDKQTNNSNYANPEFDRLYEQARVMPESPERTRLYARMVNILSEDCPVLMLTEPQSFVLVYDWVRNTKPHPIGTGYARYTRLDLRRRRELGGKEN
jgi:ABC-type transport system substrate-binding protein